MENSVDKSLKEKIDYLVSNGFVPDTINKYYHVINKLPYDNIVNGYEFLKDNGIVLSKGSHLGVLFNSVDALKSMIQFYKKALIIDGVIKDPTLLKSKGLTDRIEYCIQNRVDYLQGEGYVLDNIKRCSLFKEYLVNIASVESKENVVFDFIQESANEDADFVADVAQERDIVDSKDDGVAFVLSSDPQEINDENFEIYDSLRNILQKVLIHAYGDSDKVVISEEMGTRLFKLVCASFEPSDALFYSITYNKNLSEAELQGFRAYISEALEDSSFTKEGDNK